MRTSNYILFIAIATIALTAMAMKKDEKPKPEHLPNIKKLKRNKRSHNLKVHWKPPEVTYKRIFPPLEKKNKK